MIEAISFMKNFLLFLFLVILIGSCSGKKSSTKNKTNQTSLYNRWELLAVGKKLDENTLQTEAETNATSFRGKNLFVSFSKEGKINFNLDANSCSGTFKESADQTLVFNNIDFVCTKICCDTIRLNYHEVNRYKIEKNTLTLYSDTEVFVLLLRP